MYKKLLVLPLLLIIAGCAALGVAPANTFNKRAVVANTAIESAAATVTALYQNNKISQEDAQTAHDKLVQLADGLDLAIQIHKTDPTSADGRLDEIIVSLQALEAYLRSKQ